MGRAQGRPRPTEGSDTERMDFLISYEDLLKMAAAEKLAIKMGSVVFELSDGVRDSFRAFAEALKE